MKATGSEKRIRSLENLSSRAEGFSRPSEIILLAQERVTSIIMRSEQVTFERLYTRLHYILS